MRTPVFPHDLGRAALTKKFDAVPVAEPALPRTRFENVDTTPLPPHLAVFPRVHGYELLSVVGTGGMGIVYEARHRELNRRVAIKTLRGEALADPGFRDRFRAEAEAIAKLQHPNIIQVFAVGTVEPAPGEAHPAPYIALEFVDGGSLASRARSPQPPRAAAQMVETLARAAHAAHRLGVIHRDLKPANVLLTRGGEPKIADFGIAKQLELGSAARPRHLTRDGTVMGTPEYMAPEQLEGAAAAPAIDVYALGVILYELLTARVPFQGASFAETMMLAMRQEPVPPRRLQPGTPHDLETVCLKCLEKEPGNRYASAEALADDLARWAAGRAIRARAVGPAGRALRWARRNPAVALLSAAVCLVGLAGLTGVVWGWTEARANAEIAEANAAAAGANAAAARRSESAAHEAADNERWERYRVSVMAASSALRLNDCNAARRALDGALERHRDWVWNLLHAQLDRSRHVLRGRGGETGDVQFSPDGRWALFLGRGTVHHVWDTAGPREVGPIETEWHPRGTVISPDGRTVAYSTDHRTVVLCDFLTGRTRLVLRGHADEVDYLSFTSDGARLISTSADFTVRTWDATTGAQLALLRVPHEAQRQVRVSPDGRYAVATLARGNDLHIWNLETGRETVFPTEPGEGMQAARFSPTGDRMVTIEAYPSNAIRLWDVASGILLGTLRGHDNMVNHVEFSPDGTRLVSTSVDRTVRLWDVSPHPVGPVKRLLHTLKGHTDGVGHAAFSPDGRRVVSSSLDRTLRYWNAETGDQIAVLTGHTEAVRQAAFRADGSYLSSTASDGTVRLWDVREVERGYAVPGHQNFVYSAAFHPDGRRVASAAWDGTARLWDATTGEELARLDHGRADIVSSVALHPNGRLMATLNRREGAPVPDAVGGVRLWDIDTKKELHLWPLPFQDFRDGRLAFSPSGDLLAAACSDGRVRMWDVTTRREVVTLGSDPAAIRDVAFSPDGRLLAAGSEDKMLRVWDVGGKGAPRALRGHSGTVYAVAWNREGSLLASGSTDGTVRLWDTATWREVGLLKQGSKVYGVAFSPDGKLLATACADNLVRVWGVDSRQEVAELSGHKNYVHALAFSPDGTRLVTASGDKSLRVWDSLSAADRARRYTSRGQ